MATSSAMDTTNQTKPPQPQKKPQPLTPQASGLVGMASAIATNLVLYPLDLLKVRLQAAASRDAIASSSWFSAMAKVVRKTWAQGGLSGFYVGLTPGLIGPTVAWGSYMMAYTWSQQNTTVIDAFRVHKGTPTANFIAGVQAGMFMTLVTNPIFVVKTRMQTAYLNSLGDVSSGGGSSSSTTVRLRNVVSDLVRNEGLRGMYKGLVPAIPLTMHGALHWAVFESMKKFALQRHEVDSPKRVNLSYVETLAVASLSKVVAAVATYPLHVIKTCIQAHRGDTPISVRQVSVNIYSLNGFRGFYAGFLPHLLRTVPSSTVTMFFIEQLTQLVQAAVRIQAPKAT